MRSQGWDPGTGDYPYKERKGHQGGAHRER